MTQDENKSRSPLEQLIEAARRFYPDGIPVTDLHRLSEMLGQNPQNEYDFSTLEKPRVMGVAASTVSAFALGVFERNGMPYVVLQRRDKDRCYLGKGPYGLFGGFVDNGAGKEQPNDACIREIMEETQAADYADGKVQSSEYEGMVVDTSQFTPRKNFIDYDHEGQEPRATSTSVSISAFILTLGQVRYLNGLSEEMKSGAVKVKEVEGYDVMPLREAARLAEQEPDKFTHSFARDAILELQAEVQKGRSLGSVLNPGIGRNPSEQTEMPTPAAQSWASRSQTRGSDSDLPSH